MAVLLCSSLARAQTADAPRALKQFTIEHWTTRDGLPHNSVNRIVQDARGYLWLATWEGPVRFNGREFRVFDETRVTGLPDNGVFTAHYQASTGGVVFGGDRAGLALIDDGVWQSLPNAGGFVYDIVSEPDGSLWVATAEAGVRRIAADGSVTTFGADAGLPSNTVYRLVFDDSGVLWAATTRGLAYREPDQERFRLERGVPAVVVRGLLAHSDGSLYVGALDQMLRRAPGEATFETIAPMSGAIEGTFTVFHEGSQGDLWYGTFEHGMGRLLNGELERFTVADGLPNQHVLDIFTDHEGSTWVSTQAGLVQFREAPAISHTRRHGLVGDYVRALAQQPDGGLIVGSNRGVSVLESGQGRALPGDDAALSDLSVLSLVADNRGLLHIGSYTQGVTQWFDGQVQTRLSNDSGLPSRQVRAMAASPDGTLWLGTAAGLVRASARPGEIQPLQTYTTADGLSSDFVSALLVSQHGDLWVASLDGISRLSLEPSANETVETYDLSGLGDVRGVFGLAEDAQAVFAATDRGVLVFQQATRRWQRLDRSHGLLFEKYLGVTIDNDGDVWVGTSRGIHRLDRSALDAVLSGARQQLDVQHFGVSDGLRSPQVNTGSLAALTDQRGDVWFATAEGAARLSPRRLSEYARSRPPAVIERAIADGERFSSSSTLAPARNRLEFSYAGLGYRMPGQIRYQVRLDAIDTDWVDRGSSTVTEYTYLPPGRYRFSVRAAYPGGEWGEPAQIDFELSPHIWQQTWFWVLVALIGLALVVWLVHWRLRAMAAAQKRLARLVDEKTEELQRLSRQDSMTGLANRRQFDEALRHEILHSQRYGTPLSIAMLDVDHFKSINDRFHHAAGDAVLIRIARRLQAAVRETDLAARWGGEEFILLLPGVRLEEARNTAERLRNDIAGLRFEELGDTTMVTASFGVAQWRSGEISGEFLARVDRALYQAKDAGRDCVVSD